MPRLLAVSWDRREIRCLAATPRGQRLRVDTAVSAPLTAAVVSHGDRSEGAGGKVAAGPSDKPESRPMEKAEKADDRAAARAELATALQALLGPQKLGRLTTLVGLERADVELLNLSLPPAKDAELPELVLNQALRESTSITEDTSLDFLTLSDDPLQPRKVLAAGLPAENRRQVQEVCAAAGLRPRRLLLRPLATASLFVRLSPAVKEGVLLVNVLADAADLTIIAAGRPVYLRTVLLPGSVDQEKSAARLLAEIKRTLTAGLDAAPGGIAAVHLVAGPGEHPALLDRMRAELEARVEAFDPLSAVDGPCEIDPRQAGRFAPLLGMLLDEAAGKPALDFLNPRRPARPEDRKRQTKILIAGAAVMLLLGLFFFWDWLGSGDAEVEQLNKQLGEINAQIKKAAQQRLLATAVRDWQAGDVNWLDEFRDLSNRFPSARDLVVLRMTMGSAGKAGGGEIDIQGLVRKQDIVDRLVSNIRDAYHRIYPKRVQERLPERAYAWHFVASILVAKRDKQQFLPPPAAGEPAATPAAVSTGAGAGPTGAAADASASPARKPPPERPLAPSQP